MKNCNCDTEINRDGSGQLHRYLKALDPENIPIDDRSTEDLLVFAKRYAAQIRFYDIPESIINDGIPAKKVSWREFFRRDMAVIASSIAVTEAEGFKKEYDEVNERLQYITTPEVYAALYAPIVGMLKKIDRWYSVAIPENPLYADLKLAIDSDLKMQVQKIMAYEEGFKFVDPTVDLKIDLDGIENKEVWGLNETVPPDSSIYTGANQQEKILNASLFTEDIFHAFYNFLNKLIKESEKYIHFAMEEYPAHQPHMALFITFLQLFNRAQTQMNGLTGRLLDFYYKEVLHLDTKPSVPDRAHIVFELAKDVIEYRVKKDIALKAGPDKSGKEQLYKTTDDLVVNQAKVKELKTIFVEKENKGNVKNIKSIYARPVANSADGYGLPFETGVTSKWPSLGKGSPLVSKFGNICQEIEIAKELLLSKNETQIGFAIASPQLVLQGGNRIIALQMSALRELKGKKFEIWLSGEDGWLKIDKEITEKNEVIKTLLSDGGDLSTGMPAESGHFIDVMTATLYICLPIVEKVVVPFDLALHPGRNYITSYPVMQVMMGPGIDFNPVVFNQITISDLSLSVRVGSINLPQRSLDILLKGKVIDVATQTPLAGVNIVESKNTSNATTTDANGDFSIPTASTNIILFKLPGYKSKIIPVAGTSPIVVSMEKGDTDEVDYSALIIPSFFDGLKQLTLQNDDGLIVAGKPFDPFTAYPKLGSSLYIGSDEVFNKPVDELAINIKHLSDKVDTSTDLNYLFLLTGRQSEKAGQLEFYKLSLLERKQWTALCTYYGGDFMEGFLTQDVLFKKGVDGKPHHLPTLNRVPLSYAKEWTSQLLKGFLQLQLNFDFNPDNNSADVFQRMALLAGIFKVKEIAISYFSKLKSLDPETDQFFHVYPFGLVEIYSQPIHPVRRNDESGTLPKAKPTAYNVLNRLPVNFQRLDAAKDYLLVNANQLLLPQFTYLWPYEQYKPAAAPTANATTGIAGNINIRKKVVKEDGDAYAAKLILSASGLANKISGGDNQYSADVQEEGMLFIGIEKTQPLQMVSMLFQFAEGSAEDEDNDPPEIHWSYLTNNEWRPLKEESLVSDGTVGFQTTGIIKVEIPEDATNNNTIITNGLYWLCASVTSDSNRIPMLIDVVTQAVLASFEDNNNDQSHFDTALAAGSISKLAVAVSQISKVQQPFASYDGKHQEIGKEFYTRVSERLRHKARAITPWDYEHLVLDRFPSIYKVKCITHTDPNCLCRTDNADMAQAGSRTPVSNTTSAEFIYNVDGFIDAAQLLRLDTMPQKVPVANIKSVVIKTAFLSSEDLLVSPQARNAVREKLIKIGVNPTLITLENPAPGTERKVTMIVTETAATTTPLIKEPLACCGPQIAPGHVLLIPISNLKNRNAVNLLQPKTSRRVLLDIEAYLQKRVSPFVHVHAKNPVYEQVLVFFRVKFRDGYDKGFYMKELNKEIVHYLTPWAFDDIIEVKFGQKIYASSIINFIEERKYVDFITDFLMIVCRSGCCDDVIAMENDSHDDKDVLNKISNCCDMEILLQDNTHFIGDIVAKPSTARSLLVSAPQHIIIPYQEPEVVSPCQRRKLLAGQKLTSMDKGRLNELIEAGIKPVVETKPVPVPAAEPVKDITAVPAAVVNPIKEVAVPVPAAVVTDAIKSTDIHKSLKKPEAKKQPVKPAGKNVKPPKKK